MTVLLCRSGPDVLPAAEPSWQVQRSHPAHGSCRGCGLTYTRRLDGFVAPLLAMTVMVSAIALNHRILCAELLELGYGQGVRAVVFGAGADKPDEGDPSLEIEGCDPAIVAAGNIETDSFTIQGLRLREGGLDLTRRRPRGRAGAQDPMAKRRHNNAACSQRANKAAVRILRTHRPSRGRLSIAGTGVCHAAADTNQHLSSEPVHRLQLKFRFDNSLTSNKRSIADADLHAIARYARDSMTLSRPSSRPRAALTGRAAFRPVSPRAGW